ncbi:uncharacterized protein LOC143074392 [Mytilus galloprovincialis]|uniref:uncharacterized protein LOC143074392 n=1 Tax=Mytilus galloprovincialis TaxID=29158 RepID=UPI003F7BC125
MNKQQQKKVTKWYHCAAEGCTSDDRKRAKHPYMQNVCFHSFPTEKKNPKQREKWLKLLRRDDAYFVPTFKQRVCSLHFVDGEPTSEHPYPELFSYNNFKNMTTPYGTSIPASDTVKKLSSARSRSSATSMPTEDECVHVTDENVNLSSTIISLDPTCIVRYPPSAIKEVTVQTAHEKTRQCLLSEVILPTPTPTIDHAYSVRISDSYESKDQACQTILIGDEIDRLISLEKNRDVLLREAVVDIVTKNDESVKKYTGVPCKSQLIGIFEVLDEAEPKVKYWSGKQSTEDVNYQSVDRCKSGPPRKLSKFNEYILTLMKLRLAILSFVLGDLFGVSESRVSQIFTTWINLMHMVLTPCIKWPSRRNIKKYMPRSFQTSFPKTTRIIDCTEMFIQKPKSPTAQSRTYSSYKSHNTFKCLVCITPSGAFSVISDLWGGNTSDRYITEHSGFLDSIRPGDEIMADRGFTIRDLLTDRRATLVIPPFTKKCKWGKGKRLSAADVVKTKSIAKHRIHVERSIRRLKLFRMLSQVMDIKFKPLANQMVKVSGFICNLDQPLVTK